MAKRGPNEFEDAGQAANRPTREIRELCHGNWRDVLEKYEFPCLLAAEWVAGGF